MTNLRLQEAEFIVESDIKSKARPRATVMNGHAIIYTPKDTLYYENYVKACYKEQAHGKYFADRPLEVTIEFYFTPNQEIAKLCDDLNNKQVDIKPSKVYCQNHKDLDNLAKVILDGLNGVAFQDDKNITKLNLEKKYSDEGKEFVKVKIKHAEGLMVDEIKSLKKEIIIMEKMLKIKSKPKMNKSDLEKLGKYANELNLIRYGKELTEEPKAVVMCCNTCKHHSRVCIDDSMEYICDFDYENYKHTDNSCEQYEKE